MRHKMRRDSRNVVAVKQMRNPVETGLKTVTTDLRGGKPNQTKTQTAQHAKQNKNNGNIKQKDNDPRTPASHAAVQHQLMGLEMMA